MTAFGFPVVPEVVIIIPIPSSSERSSEDLQRCDIIYGVKMVRKWTPEKHAIARTHARASSSTGAKA
jgi:hypothetical protein